MLVHTPLNWYGIQWWNLTLYGINSYTFGIYTIFDLIRFRPVHFLGVRNYFRSILWSLPNIFFFADMETEIVSIFMRTRDSGMHKHNNNNHNFQEYSTMCRRFLPTLSFNGQLVLEVLIFIVFAGFTLGDVKCKQHVLWNERKNHWQAFNTILFIFFDVI